MTNREEKNQKFTQTKQNKVGLYSILGIVAVMIIIASYFAFGNNDNSNTSVNAAAADTGQKVNYGPNDKLEQTIVEGKVENGNAIVSLSAVKENKFIWTEYNANGKRVPLTAFIQPDGKVMVAVSFCEPCNGERFHITDNQLVCNACGTIWDLQTLKGISGGCLTYPPEALTYSLNGDNLEIPQTVLDAWVPRV